ncbi:MAG: hypothetical protein JWP27_1971 [Flaviaesturariibacter sp.]|nr:hypothetical protein [Flaviaesturariibacter sp.]
MEHLFITQLSVNGQQTDYEVVFADETYHFRPKDQTAPVIRARREQDEWHVESPVADALREEALGKLDTYLLSQH